MSCIDLHGLWTSEQRRKVYPGSDLPPGIFYDLQGLRRFSYPFFLFSDDHFKLTLMPLIRIFIAVMLTMLKRRSKRMNLYKRKIAAAALMTLMCMSQAITAWAAGPGDAMTGSSTAGSSTNSAASSDAWSGYTNEDGSAFSYLEKGTEVSRFQNDAGEINWNKVKAAGLDFVMVRISYGLTEDQYFDTNVSGALAAGLKVGAYVCSTAKNMDQLVAEANLAIEKIKKYKLQYPVAYDVEVSSILSEGASKEDITAMANKFCSMVQAAGYTPIVYANKTWLTTHMNVSDIPYDVWYASYAADKVYRPVSGTKTTIWQSSEKGIIDGIKGNITTEFSKKAYGGGSGAVIYSKGTQEKISAVIPVPSSASETTTAVVNASGPAATGSAAGTSSGSIQTQESPAAAISSNGPVNGWVKTNDQWFYYENGKQATGWRLVDGNWYYMEQNGVMASGWRQVNGVWYWLASDGAMRTGWRYINNVWYYMNESGAMLANTTATINGVSYSFDASGAWIQ